MNTHIASSLIHDLDHIRQSHPIVHSITNWVTMQTIANALLSLGASPIMAHAPEELLDITHIAQALVINIGTLDATWLHSIEIAQRYARTRSIPIIFDPVGAGATTYRTEAAKKILETGVTILRANASEIIGLGQASRHDYGIDAKHQTEDAISAAQSLCERYHCTIVISGKEDIIIDRTRMQRLAYGSPLFTKVTGMGCAVTACIGAFAAINPDAFLAATHAMAIFTLAGEKAAQSSLGPGTFLPALLDALHTFQESDLVCL